MIEIVVPGPVVSFRRPSGGGGFRRFTPEKMRNYRARLRDEAALAMRGREPFDFGTPLSIYVRAEFPVPASWSKLRKALALEGTIRPTGRPDIDNIVKLMDSFNKVVWKDDTQIVKISACKFYGSAPYVMFRVWPLEEDDTE